MKAAIILNGLYLGVAMLTWQYPADCAGPVARTLFFVPKNSNRESLNARFKPNPGLCFDQPAKVNILLF
jgi:hypothetical protein